MQDRLNEIKAREAAATPGPWSKYEMEFDDLTRDENLDFMCGARQDIPWLIEQVERLQAENERLKKE